MDYEGMWNELKTRIDLSITSSIPRRDLLQFMALLEQHFTQKSDEDKELKEFTEKNNLEKI